MDYPQLVRELFPKLTGGIRWGLERTLSILADAGDPHRAYPSIHIGGTNGKGTACAVAESILRASGLRTGLYTSPHLTSFRERIRIDGVPVEEASLLESANRLWPSIEREQPSFFEATTAIAFDVFAREAVDVAVVEVGLGGRLDSTNVVMPDVAVVTQIGVDHVEFLGSDPKGIAAEKAGIAKPGVPFLTGEPDDALFAVLHERASAAGARVERLPPGAGAGADAVRAAPDGVRVALDTERWGRIEASLPLAGAHQARNAALAVRAIELSSLADRVSAEDVRRGIEATRWPGRFQVERLDGTTWVFDVAHNPPAIERLAATVEAADLPRPRTVLVGVMGDKDWRAILGSLAGVADALVLTRPAHAPAGRAWDPAAAAREGAPSAPALRVVPDLEQAVRDVRSARPGSVLVTGSFHTVGEALVALGIDLGWEPDPAV